MANWAISRYATAGVELPPLVIRFPGRDLSHCGGAHARVYLDHDPIEIRMCWNSEFILLRELAHVWVAHNVARDKRESFMAMRAGVESWASRNLEWHERGGEHAANVIAWGLLEDPYPISRTYPNDPERMIEAFVHLTGVEPLHDGGSGVQEPDRSLFAGRSNPRLESGRWKCHTPNSSRGPTQIDGSRAMAPRLNRSKLRARLVTAARRALVKP